MNFSARLTRRFAICSVALATVAASLVFTTGTAHASSCYDLDANAGQSSGPGSIIFWGCNGNDPYQNWWVSTAGSVNGDSIITLQNFGSNQCLDLDVNYIGPGGQITQDTCDPTYHDLYQQWVELPIDNGEVVVLESYGVWLNFGGENVCVDGALQNNCEFNQPFEQWTVWGGSWGFLFRNTGASEA